MMMLAPAVTIHSLADARIALAPGLPVTLVSAPGAALFAGAGWWMAMMTAARAERPDLAWTDVLDCGDAPGRAAEALRAGHRLLVLQPAPAGSHGRVRIMAAALHAVLLPERPETLDLARPKANRKLADWLGQGPRMVLCGPQGDNRGGFR